MKTADGFFVSMDLGHLKQHQDVLPFLPQALQQVTTQGKSLVKVQVDLGEIIGTSACVETDDNDDIVYCRRVGRQTITRFVKSKEPTPCSLVTVIMKKVGKSYHLITAYIGKLAEKEPGDLPIGSRGREISELFWSKHALVWGTQKV